MVQSIQFLILLFLSLRWEILTALKILPRSGSFFVRQKIVDQTFCGSKCSLSAYSQSQSDIMLRGELEMFLDCCDSDQCSTSSLPPEFAESGWVKELMKKRLETQVSDLDAATKSVQRLILQLDRSDGRPDIAIHTLSDRFYDFTSSCLRCRKPPSASDGIIVSANSQQSLWTAAVAPLEYVGLRLEDHWEDVSVGGEMIRVVDVAGVCLSAARSLLDAEIVSRSGSVNNKETAAAAIRTLLKLTKDQIRSVMDLTLSITRILLRMAIFKDESQRHNPPLPVSSAPAEEAFVAAAFSSLELSTRLPDALLQLLPTLTSDPKGDKVLEDVLIPSFARLVSLLELDLRLEEEDMPIKGSNRLLLRREAISEAWLQVQRPI